MNPILKQIQEEMKTKTYGLFNYGKIIKIGIKEVWDFSEEQYQM